MIIITIFTSNDVYSSIILSSLVPLIIIDHINPLFISINIIIIIINIYAFLFKLCPCIPFLGAAEMQELDRSLWIR